MKNRHVLLDDRTARPGRAVEHPGVTLPWRVFLALACALACALAAASVAAGLLAPGAGSRESRGGAHLERAHAHNDYEHDRPLLDALDAGFKSVEADVWLIDGELVPTTEPPRGTLESFYLDNIGG